MEPLGFYGPGGPMTVKALSEQAKQYDWNPDIPFKFWARAADTIYREGEVSYHEGNLSNAYMLLMRYSILVLEDMPNHPEAKPEKPKTRTLDVKRAMNALRSRIPDTLEALEAMRPEIDEAYEKWRKRTAAEREKAMVKLGSPPSPTYAKHAANDPALSWNYSTPPKILNAAENPDLAVNLAKKEMQRRRQQGGLSVAEISKRRAAGIWDGARLPIKDMDDEELRRQMSVARQRYSQSHTETLRDEDERKPTSSTTYHYPSIHKSSAVNYERSASPPRRLYESRHFEPIKPTRPPKYLPDRELDQLPPPLPAKEPPASFSQPPKRAHDHIDEEERVIFAPAAYLENGTGLRSVFLPKSLPQEFLRLAANNTRRNLEMCGILCGSKSHNAYFITHLLIPEQKCTSDTCETTNEAAQLMAIVDRGLVVVGWIHTHPTQTCFLSSRDLHTHASYQQLMPESIAIVCAPRHDPSLGIFRLTNPPGLDHINITCKAGDSFHQHSIDNLYVDAEHAQFHAAQELEIVDLRP